MRKWSSISEMFEGDSSTSTNSAGQAWRSRLITALAESGSVSGSAGWGAPRNGAVATGLRSVRSGRIASRNSRLSLSRLSPTGALDDMLGSSVICRSLAPCGRYGPATNG